MPTGKNRSPDESITHSRMLELINYDQITGVFTWVDSSRPGTNAQSCGSITPQGYRTICIEGKRYQAQRLAVFYMTGKWPKSHEYVVHKNKKRDDNRAENLSILNNPMKTIRAKTRDGTKGRRGVRYENGVWKAEYVKDGRLTYLGRYETKNEAIAARDAVVFALYGDLAELNRPRNFLKTESMEGAE